ncbi:Uncharacterised protein [Flavonifractor plautii]|uniref:Uncharacterized protein n=1 Tax=Flavonifractor plautii TaxID=292800 RepID=A0A174U3R9_FLAPL|nr:Uncharacterised protein [Flavonifractor plautii]
MEPTSYWESTRAKSLENSSSSMGASPRIWAHCSRPPQRISQSWAYSSASAACPRRFSSSVRWASRSGTPAASRKA